MKLHSLPNIVVSYIKYRTLHLTDVTNSDISFKTHHYGAVHRRHHGNLYNREKNWQHSWICHVFKPNPVIRQTI